MASVAHDAEYGFLSGGGELARLIAAHDWSATSLGRIEGWSGPVRTAVGTMLRAPLPIVMLLGEPGVMIYNDAYAEFAGARHPGLLGMDVLDAWPEAADLNAHVIETVFRRGETLVYRDQLLQLNRPGRPDAVWLDLSYSPVPARDGTPLGVIAIVVETTERVAAQELIRASEAQFRSFAQAMPNHVWTAPADGRLDWFNDRVIEYTGLSQAELIGAGWNMVIHPDDLAVANDLVGQSFDAGAPHEAEFRIRAADGEYRWHLARVAAIRADDGRIIRWIGTNTDIHDKKLAEAETTRDRDRLWTLSRDLMLVCDMQSIVTAVNPTATRLLGWSQDEMIGRPLSDFVHPDDVESTAHEVAKLAEGATTLAFENRYRCREGGYRLLDWTAVPDGDRIHGVGRDITEHRNLARERDRVWNLSPIVKIVSDSRSRILAVNPSWTYLLGWSAEETVGRQVQDFLDPADHTDHVVNLNRLFAGETLRNHERVFLTRDGGRRRLAFTIVPEAGTIYAFGRDITAESEAAEALAQAEDALRQSQKMEAVGQLTGGIAHDFNNLLQGISGSLEIVQRRVAQGRFADLERFITGATTAASRAAALTHRLLAFSRRQPLDPRPVRANPLIASMEDLLRRTLGERTALELVLAAGLWPTLCDPNQLENAVLNLAINARDAMQNGGHLTIETCNAHLDDAYTAQLRDVRPGQYVCICVTDTGTGMSAETVARAFEPFFTTKPIGQGTGLGLSMIYGFARQSEGYAKIYSELGKGTTFKLYLPRHRGEVDGEEELPQLGEAHAADHGEVVLVVEDEPVVRGLIVETLIELGYTALEAADGPKGVDILQSRRRIDLLVTDIGLPGLNGRQVADAGRQLRPGLKVLFMTGYAENAALASGFLEPGMSMITKPFAMEAFATRIRAIVKGNGEGGSE